LFVLGGVGKKICRIIFPAGGGGGGETKKTSV